MRVYGALMWSLGKVIHTPEVARVYIGSFWDQPFLYADNRALFEAEASDLIGDLQTLPDNAALRKINDLIKRARLAKVFTSTSPDFWTIFQVQAFIIAYLHEKMPGVFGNKRKEKEKLINNLAQIFQELFHIKDRYLPSEACVQRSVL